MMVLKGLLSLGERPEQGGEGKKSVKARLEPLTFTLVIKSLFECRTVDTGIVPLCRVVIPVYKHRDNDLTQ